MVGFLPSITSACLLGYASAFSPCAISGRGLTSLRPSPDAFSSSSRLHAFFTNPIQDDRNGADPRLSNAFAAATALLSIGLLTSPLVAHADTGAELAGNSKITTGGASTLQSGRTITISRGVNLSRSDFKGQNLKGVAFQQSIVTDTDFRGTNLVGASFFDATLDGSDFEGADMSLCNVEMAQFNRANLKNAILSEVYVSGSTLFEGVKDIEGSDWSETFLRADQKKYLCNHPTAKGTNPTTGVDTRESLMCKD